MNNIVYTIGYTAFAIEDFIKQLKNYNIKCIIDVRSVPIASEFYKDYSKNVLEPILKKNNIYYRNYVNEFGARQENDKYYQKYGYLDFDEFILTDAFKSGVTKIKKGMDMSYTFALMCAEKDPINCHRSIMVGKGLKKYGLKVEHILFDGNTISQEGIEEKLLEMYFPNRCQLSLFDTKTDNDYINEAYQLQNKKIGYKKEKVA